VSLLSQPLTIVPMYLSSAQARQQSGLMAQSKRSMSYFEAITAEGDVLATFHMGQGIVIKGQSEMWRVLKQPNIESLMQPGMSTANAAASIFKGTTNLFGRVCRITVGVDRLGGYVLEGNGWRGSRIRRATDGVRVANLYAEGDPPEIFHLDPARAKPEIPMAVAYLVLYFLLEREIRHGSWISRPTSSL